MNDERKSRERSARRNALYVPKSLSKEDKRKQIKSIKEGKDRPIVKSFKSRKSKWTILARNYFGEDNTSKEDMSRILSKGNKQREKQIRAGLDKIFRKAEGAYYSSGSRPNQTKESWGYGRVFSVLFGGKSREIDKKIVKEFNIPLLFKKKQTKNAGVRAVAQQKMKGSGLSLNKTILLFKKKYNKNVM